MAPTTPVCRFDPQWRSDCRLRISKLGDVLVRSKFDFCTAPPLLDMSVQIDQHTWKLSFVATNRRESRVIGLEYWPLRLHISFYDSAEFGDGRGQAVVGCIESVKNGEELCFLNTTVSSGPGDDLGPYYAPCPSTEAVSSSTLPIVILCLLLTLLIVVVSVGSFVWWRRRQSRKHLCKQLLETCVPPLPQSKPYVENLNPHGSKSSHSLLSRSRPTLNPITEEDSTISGHYLGADPVDSSFRSPSKWRESKLIQTSLPSLEAAQQLISEPSSSGHSENGSCQGSSSPNGGGSQVNDKEKLICSSSSESSV